MGKVKISTEKAGENAREQELIDNYRLQLTERIVRHLAHEIRNPLTNVMLGLEQLKNEFPESNETADIYFDIIKRNCDRINDLITSLVNASKPADTQTVPCSINKLIDEVLNLSAEAGSNFNIRKNFSDNIPDLNVDPLKMKLAFKNIVDNAVHAMRDFKGELEVKSDIKDNQCMITFKDNGMGILPEDINKIFDPFYRVKSNGSGLGLTLTQNIINTHKGNIKVSSTPGEGTIVTVILNV
jgi:two-component system, sporulation sensor kinase E